ncbi:MAG: GTPase domain-containing protein [Synergistaceae bacterium]|nr:GTPase domain-containing protein [Synergistaceae bacterium]
MIYENIQAIIQQRQPMAFRVAKVREALSLVVNNFEKFHLQCMEIFKDKAIANEFGNIIKIPEDFEKITAEITQRRDELKHLERRLSRGTLNIAVIGRARQGKSRLLQTITGLSTTEIPDGDGQFCTGVRSDIINEDTDLTYAVVNFLSESKFINEKVAPYFEALREYKPDSFSITPTSLQEFKNIPLPAVSSFEKYSDTQTAMRLHLQNLTELQSHAAQYEELLNSRPLRIKKEEIRKYVAQDDSDGNRVYFNHFAVDNVEIYCKFPKQDVGNLRLIDLPGLGDMRFGDVSRLINALKDQVDLVLFLSKPSNSGQSWNDVDIDLYSKARSALGEKLPIERWAFWVFNRDSRLGADNEKQCRMLQETIAQAQIKVADTVIVDCTNEEAVSTDLINRALEHLSKNIEQNDKEYAENLQNVLNATVSDMRHFAEKIRRSLTEGDSDMDRDYDTFEVLFSGLWEDIRMAMNNLVGPDSELRKNREKPYEELQNQIEKVLDDEGIQLPLTENDIQKYSVTGGGILRTYENALDYLRTRLSGKLQERLDEILTDALQAMKSQFCKILATTGRLKLQDNGRFKFDDYRLLGEMIDFIEASGYSQDMPKLLTGLKLLDTWTMSYRSFIQHRVRKALNGLDPNDEECISQGRPNDAAQAFKMLEIAYKETADRVKQALKDVYTEPNEAAFAVAEEFKDIMIRSDEMLSMSEDNTIEKQRQRHKYALTLQWKRFYRPIRGDIWPEEFGSSQKRRDINTKLRGSLDTLLPLLANEKFEFLR